MTPRRSLRHLSLAFATAIGTAACGGSDAANDLIGTWQQTNSESRIGTAPWEVADDVACRADNTEEYGADGAWTLYDGTNQCGGGTGIVHGTWRLAASDTKIIYTYVGSSGEYESSVESLSGTDLILTNSTGLTSGEQTRSTYRKR